MSYFVICAIGAGELGRRRARYGPHSARLGFGMILSLPAYERIIIDGISDGLLSFESFSLHSAFWLSYACLYALTRFQLDIAFARHYAIKCRL